MNKLLCPVWIISGCVVLLICLIFPDLFVENTDE